MFKLVLEGKVDKCVFSMKKMVLICVQDTSLLNCTRYLSIFLQETRRCILFMRAAAQIPAQSPVLAGLIQQRVDIV